MAVINENIMIAAVKTVLVGHLFTSGAMRMAPTHWAA
jgi:hypothetical protein